MKSREEELINEPRQRAVTPRLEGCAGTCPATTGQRPRLPRHSSPAMGRSFRSFGAAPGLSAAGPACVATAAEDEGEIPWAARHARSSGSNAAG